MNRIIIVTLAVTAIVAIHTKSGFAQEPNSGKDPYGTDLSKRQTAGAPVPYGFDLGTRYAFSAKTKEGSAPGFTIGGDAYYDAWQLGYHVEDYGNVVRLAMRTMGRENWTGWFVETGSGSIDTGHGISYPYSLIGAGFQYSMLARVQGVSGGFTMTIATGGATGSGNINGSSWTLGSGLYFSGAFTYLIRIPINTMALTIGAQAFGLFRPSLDDSPNTGFGFGITGNYAFNFQN